VDKRVNLFSCILYKHRSNSKNNLDQNYTSKHSILHKYLRTSNNHIIKIANNSDTCGFLENSSLRFLATHSSRIKRPS
jgi:hypothetical protein